MKKGSEGQPQAEATNKKSGVMDCSSDYDCISSIDVAFSMVSHREREQEKETTLLENAPLKQKDN